MDISLRSWNKSEINGNIESSVRPKARVRRMAAGPRRQSKVMSDQKSEDTVPKQTKRTISTFRWRSSPDVVLGCLKGMHLTISGTLNCLTPEDLIEMIETCGGTIYKTLAKKSDYLLIGSNASKNLIKTATDSEKTILNEQEFIDLVRTKSRSQKFYAYREKNQGRDWSDLAITSDSSD